MADILSNLGIGAAKQPSGPAGNFYLSDIKFVKRIVVGNSDPNQMLSDDEIQEQMDFLNRCLAESPKGSILGVDKNFMILGIGDNQVVLQSVAYHVGWKRKPYWLIEEEGQDPSANPFGL